MSPSTRKKILIGVGGFVGLLVVAALAVPAFIDLDKFKPEIVAQAKKATGRDLVLEGPVTLSLLPVPAVGVSKVRFANAPGSKNPNMVEIKAITVKPSVLALLGGNVEVSSVTLVEPKIVLEVNAQGKPNWEFAPSVEEAKPAAAKPSSPKPLSLGSLVVENGTLLFSDSKAGIQMMAEKANITASVGSLDGPYALSGSATLNGAPLKVDLSVSSKGTNGYATDLSLEANGKLGFKGTLSELGPNARLGGVATVSTDSLTGFVATLMGLAGQPVPALPPLLAGKFSFDGSIDASQTDFAAKDFKMALGDSSGTGALSVKLKPQLAVDGKLVMAKLDLDKTLAGLAQPAAAAKAPAKPAPAPAPSSAAKGGSILDGVNAHASIDIGEVTYNKQAIRNVALEVDARGGVVAVPRLAATLPGDLVLQAKSSMTGGAVSGDFSLAGTKLRDTLKWLDVDVASVPANKLTSVSLKGRMSSANGNVAVSDAAFQLDDLKGTGGMLVTFSVPLSVVTHIEIDTLDVDSFMPKQAEAKKATPAAKPAAAPAPAAADIDGPSVGLKLKIAKVLYNKETIGGVDVDVALQGSTLKVNQADVANLGGGRFALRGNVANFSAPNRRTDVAYNFEAPDIDKVLKIFGGTANTGLGRVASSGGLAGTPELMNLKDLTVAASGDTVKMNGTVSAPGAASGTPSSVGYKGSFAVNSQAIEVAAEVKVAERPMITLDLKAATLDLDKLQSHAAAPARPAAPARGQAAATPAAAMPIDTGPMRGVDASVKLTAGTLISAPLRINNADLAVTLKNGVLTLEHFKGGLFGGTLGFSGTVDGSKPALGIALKGDANNISLGEMLRGTSGSNTFGSVVKVSIDGQLSATGITVNGAGSTSEQIKGSLSGGAQLGGHVLVGADKALTMIGSAAAGAVGGAIDSTLGTALGAVGQKGGVGAGNMLNAISLVLNRFVNHDSPISGHVEIAGGVLTDRSLVVQGNKAAANITTRTNLAASTTDTTINFTIAEDGSAPYLITTARGPMSSPSLNVTRGTAKDPPGMANTLTNSIPGVGGGSGGGGQQAPSIAPKIPLPNLFGR
jgi:uncharacterized protein involved in outer membrane biogenesis